MPLTCKHVTPKCLFVHVPQNWGDDPKWHFIMMKGFAESMSPGILGFPLLALTAMLCAVGMNRLPPDVK